MRDVRNKAYEKMYEESCKLETIESFALISYMRGNGVIEDIEVDFNDSTLEEAIFTHTPDMISITVYQRAVGLFDDLIVYGPAINIGRTVYFGKRITVDEYNRTHAENLDNGKLYVVILDNGVALSDVEDNFTTHLEVLDEINKMQEAILKRV